MLTLKCLLRTFILERIIVRMLALFLAIMPYVYANTCGRADALCFAQTGACGDAFCRFLFVFPTFFLRLLLRRT